ncbi:MAG: 2Fe-2S iron-sulfur cluster-binding protein [Planctomycetota bacterium]|nr:2Fe-2S iron-sulfur cluster-binding protein [Planctomycetota bacterium]
MIETFEVSFGDSTGLDGQSFPAVELSAGAALSEELDIHNSPVLFGCRTGICGTCLVTAEPLYAGEITEDEQEILDVYAPGQKGVRLACQMRLQGPLSLRPLGRPKA